MMDNHRWKRKKKKDIFNMIETTYIASTDDIANKLFQHENKSLLRFITCGSVDDGKSTLIGRLLYETNALYTNELETLHHETKRFGTTDEGLDFSLLVDGLSSEREQGITIDVAYRFFSTEKRKFIVADTPGHEQYTRNMATGASTAEAAVVILDARKGVLTQTKRHSFIVSLLGVKHIILAVNKMDLVDYSQTVFSEIELAYRAFAEHLDFEDISVIPLSALKGENICTHSFSMRWYKGPTLLKALEEIDIQKNMIHQPFRMSVQWVNRPHHDFRGYTGTISSGQIKPQDLIRIMPGDRLSRVERIVTYQEDLPVAIAGQSITLTLADEIDVSRGMVFAADTAPCEVGSQFYTTFLWMSDKAMVSGRQYIFKSGSSTAVCTLGRLKHAFDINLMQPMPAHSLSLNEIGEGELFLNKEIAFAPYAQNRMLGSYILIDRISHETVACGWIQYVLRRSNHIHAHAFSVNMKERGEIKGHQACVVWLTGISGAGKSTIANELEQRLNEQKVHTVILDGDNIRTGLNKDLGFTDRDRAENIRRVAEVAKLMSEAGLVCIVSFISPFQNERQMAQELIGQDKFIEVFIDTPLEEAERRDVKGLYLKARKGTLKNFTGIHSPYEVPETPAIHIHTQSTSALESAQKIVQYLRQQELIP